MMQLTKEGKRTINNLNLLAKHSPELGQRIITELGADAEKEIKPRVPIDSASLVSTLRKEIGKLKVTLITGGMLAKFSRKGKERKYVDYAVYVNDGTSKQPGRFFMERGVYAAFNKVSSIAKTAMNNWLRKIVK